MEYQRYRDYLAQLKEEEARQERELETMLEAEQKKVLEKRRQQMLKEKEARQKLMQEVIESRKAQIHQRSQLSIELSSTLDDLRCFYEIRCYF